MDAYAIGGESIVTTGLNIGDCLKYKDLCNILKQPTYGGKQKKTQLDNFSRYFAYEKDGVRYIITDIYEEPLKEVYKYPSNTLYTELIEKILLQYLSKQSGYKTYIAPVQLWHQLGMVNEYFLKYKNESAEELIKINPTVSVFEINDFYKRCRSKFSNIITSSFKSLQNRRLIEFHYIPRIGVRNAEGEMEFFDANETEEKEIIKIERQVLVELGLDSMKQLGFSKLTKTFYKRTTELFKEQYGWDGVFRFYKIIYNQDDVIEAISKEELDSNKKALNERIIKALNENAEYNYDKAGITSDNIQEIMWDNKGKLPDNIFYYPITYVDKQMWLTDTLIRTREIKEGKDE